jgi:hypothetical protein
VLHACSGNTRGKRCTSCVCVLQVLGKDAWRLAQQAVLQAWGHRCTASGTPVAALSGGKGAVTVVPQWAFDARRREVYLADLVPLARPLLQLKQRCEAAAALLAAQPGVQAAQGAWAAAMAGVLQH